MKTAIYIENNITQIVLTPETEFEKAALAACGDNASEVKIIEGEFYHCVGGWTRMSEDFGQCPSVISNNPKSLMIRVDKSK